MADDWRELVAQLVKEGRNGVSAGKLLDDLNAFTYPLETLSQQVRRVSRDMRDLAGDGQCPLVGCGGVAAACVCEQDAASSLTTGQVCSIVSLSVGEPKGVYSSSSSSSSSITTSSSTLRYSSAQPQLPSSSSSSRPPSPPSPTQQSHSML